MDKVSPIRSPLSILGRKYVEFHTRSPFKLWFIGLIGMIAFPVYYVVWSSIARQPYESLPLRTFGVVLCTLVAARDHWPAALRPYYFPYCYVALMLCLPVFFTYMTLMNGANAVWLMSTMAALLFVLLLYDVANAIVVSVVGSCLGAAWFLYVHPGQPFPAAYLVCIPVFCFALAAMAFLALSEQSIAKEKLLAAEVLASNIAHEIRTPLLGIRCDAENLELDIAALAQPAQWALQNGWKRDDDAMADIAAMSRATSRIRDHTLAANQVIDMLLARVTAERAPKNDFAMHSLEKVIDEALGRFHFRSSERTRVRTEGHVNSKFLGSDVLMMHVVFNLLKNALSAIGHRPDGEIVISLGEDRDAMRVVFADNGVGIPSEILPVVFMPFVTSGRRMQGTGLGLAFCKMVIESFGGSITVTSTHQDGTAFTITLPQPPSEEQAGHAAPTAGRLASAGRG